MSIQIQLYLPRERFELNVNFEIAPQGFTALIGPSGSGKTTILRCIAGLERAQRGVVRVSGEVWQSANAFTPAHRRSVGYVFQNASLLPHLTVMDNLKYALKRSQAAEHRISITDVTQWFGLTHLLTRHPHGLSGGEQQRAALARALITNPKLLLMDEPLSSLDQASKIEILPYLKRLHQETAIPIIYVSHDLNEVAQLAETVVVLERGHIQSQQGISEHVGSGRYCPHCSMPLAMDT